MAEPLVARFGLEVPRLIATQLAQAGPFDTRAFIDRLRKNYDSLYLMQRAIHIADALHACLPAAYPRALEQVLKSLGPPLATTEGHGMTPFLYLPHTLFVARHGLEHFDFSMQAQYQLTQRFTAEFSIRPFIERYPTETLALLTRWAEDPNVHVRRLVSEGTRPRLPWASRLKQFQKDPSPVLQLLELLKDDPELYVRRSVANNLNDIGKDHPDQLMTTARRWFVNATPQRQWIVKHALRFAIKRGDSAALAVLGYGKVASVSISDIHITPARPRLGDAVDIRFAVTNTGRRAQEVLVDFCIHYRKANGQARAKTFKLSTATLPPGAHITVGKRISLRNMTTRKHYPGVHRVEALINGQAHPLGQFTLRAGH